MPTALLFALLASLVAIGYGAILIRWMLAKPQGDDKMRSIAKTIQQGAFAHLMRQIKSSAVVAVIIFILLSAFLNYETAIGFLAGAVLSGLAGFVGMMISVRANVRTAEAAKNGLAEALAVAFRGGSVTGMMAVGLGLLGVAAFYAVTRDVNALIGLGLGGSLTSIFARLGGGIFAKTADVGTNLVEKTDAGIPGDESRDPAVIAGNVGGCAGMTADLFETYALTAIAAMLLGSLVFGGSENAIVYPLALGGISIIASVIGTFAVRLGIKKNVMGALCKGLAISSIVAAILFYPTTAWLMGQNGRFSVMGLYLSSLVGIAVAALIFAITEYFTSTGHSPVRGIAEASQAGHGTNVVAGLALSMRSTAAPVFVICAGIMAAHGLAGIYGIAVASMAMLSLTGIVVAIDAFGPIADNADGIAKMAGLPQNALTVTGQLETAGNTAKTVTKGYATGSAALAAVVLFNAYTEKLAEMNTDFSFSLSEPKVIIGLFLGGLVAYCFAGLAMTAASRAAGSVVEEVRRQFREIGDVMKVRTLPDCAKCVDAVTKAAIREMIAPALLPVAAPLIVGLLFKRLLGPEALGGLLVGAIVCGIFIAVSMTTGGAAWDNAKKHIETGVFGGKNSLAHQAAITGDTVGDPCKDTVGPAINPMIKIMNVVALLITGLMAG